MMTSPPAAKDDLPTRISCSPSCPSARGRLLLLLAPFEDFAEGLFDFRRQGEAEGCVEGVEGEGAEAADGGDQLLPALLGAAGVVEGLPEFVDEEVDEGAGRGLG